MYLGSDPGTAQLGLLFLIQRVNKPLLVFCEKWVEIQKLQG